jgi:hypothetical protein
MPASRARFSVVMFLLAVLACGDREGPPDEASEGPAAAATPGAVADPGSARGCPAWGAWQVCSVEDRLTRAGLVVQRDSQPVRRGFLRVPGIRYRTFRAEFEVFLYPTREDRVRDTDALDSATVSPRGEPAIIWPTPATLVTSGNLAAIILSLNDRQAERIALALGAGLPAGPPR